MAKRAVNWLEIKERYLLGEPPRLIAGDYKNLTASTISKKANREGWRGEKGEKQEKISREIETRVIENVLLSRERLFQELAYIAYADMADYARIEPNGTIRLVPFDAMPPGASRAVSKIKEKRKTLAGGEEEDAPAVIEVQLEYAHHDKLKAIGMLLEALGFAKPVIETDDDGEKITLTINRQAAHEREDE